MNHSNKNKYGNAYGNANSNHNKHGNTNINKHTHDNANASVNANANTNTNPNTLKKQGGYTLVELGLVLIVILILGGVIYASFTALYNSAKDQQVEKEILQFNLALHRCLDRDRASLSACDGDKILLYSGLTSDTTACGDTWSAASSENSVVFTYPLTKCEDGDELGASLAQKINKLPKVSAVYTPGTGNLVVTGDR
jgi:type II secretory pathway pseudopilin PulG